MNTQRPMPDRLDRVWNHPLPRLIRFVDPGVLPRPVVAALQEEHNLLLIDRELYAKLSPTDQHRARRVHHTLELA